MTSHPKEWNYRMRAITTAMIGSPVRHEESVYPENGGFPSEAEIAAMQAADKAAAAARAAAEQATYAADAVRAAAEQANHYTPQQRHQAQLRDQEADGRRVSRILNSLGNRQ